MDTKVKVNYAELALQIDKIVKKLEEEKNCRETISNIVNQSDAWKSKAASEFEKHINHEFIPWLKKVLNSYNKQISNLEKTIIDYKKLDRL